MHDTYAGNPRLLPLSRNEQETFPEERLPRVTTNHNVDWADAIREGRQPSSPFTKAGPLTETVLMGNLAVRAYDYRLPKPGGEADETYRPGRTKLLWDGPNMRITNIPELNFMVGRENYREGWELPTA